MNFLNFLNLISLNMTHPPRENECSKQTCCTIQYGEDAGICMLDNCKCHKEEAQEERDVAFVRTMKPKMPDWFALKKLSNGVCGCEATNRCDCPSSCTCYPCAYCTEAELQEDMKASMGEDDWDAEFREDFTNETVYGNSVFTNTHLAGSVIDWIRTKRTLWENDMAIAGYEKGAMRARTLALQEAAAIVRGLITDPSVSEKSGRFSALDITNLSLEDAAREIEAKINAGN